MKIMTKKVFVASLLIISVISASFAASNFKQVVTASPNPIVRPEPPIIVVPKCTTGDTAIGVENFADLGGFQFKIWWPKGVVDLAGSDWKLPYPPPWQNVMTFGPIPDENATHKAAMFAIMAGPLSSPFTYPGLWRFIDLEWHCIQPGVDGPLTFDRVETRLFDIFGGLLPIEGIVDGLVINPPPPPEMYWKANYTDYAPSGVPDFDQRQDGWNVTALPFLGYPYWTWCAPTAVANSLWWMDSRYETSTTPPPAISNTFPLVSSYTAGIDDHDPANVVPFIAHLGYLMDTDGSRTGRPHAGTNIFDMQAGIAHYLSWTGVNPKGDVNGDGTVDQTDVNIVNAAFGSSIVGGVPNGPWNMAADVYPVTLGWPNRGVADNKVDAMDIALVAGNVGKTGMFYEKTVRAPEFDFVEDEVERCEDVILSIGFYRLVDDVWIRAVYDPPFDTLGLSGHALTVAGVNSTTLHIAVSDPMQNNAEAGGLGRVLPAGIAHNHPAIPPDAVHNNASFVSHDAYKANLTLPNLPLPANFSLINYANPYPGAPQGDLAVVEWAITVSPIPPPPPPPAPPAEVLKKLIDIVEWPTLTHNACIAYVDTPFPFVGSGYEEIQGYEEILTCLQEKGYVFDPADGTAMNVTLSYTLCNHTDNIYILYEERISGTVTSWWSHNTLENGTRACMLSAQMNDGSTMAMAFVTNLLPPEQVPGVDPYLIVNAMPYMYVRFYWWSWDPIGKIVSWSYWWYDSHSHPNWFWAPYWWWRVYVRAYIPSVFTWVNYQWVHSWPFPWAHWRPWWGWWWHWIYWRHWYWWSTYFPYDP